MPGTGISAEDTLADAARDTPATPRTETVFVERLMLDARFVCDIAEILLHIGQTAAQVN